MPNWYENEKNVIELAEFLVQSEEISTTDDLLDFFKYPYKYTEVWNIYEEQILGKEHTRQHIKSLKNGKFSIPINQKIPTVKSDISCACWGMNS